MNFNSLSSYLEQLEKNGSLKRIQAEVSPEYEITEIVNRLYQESVGNGREVPALLFENVKGSKCPLAINLLGMDGNLELLLGDKPEKIGQKFYNAFTGFQKAAQNKEILSWAWSQRDLFWKALSARTRSVSKAPCKDVILSGHDIDLGAFPVLKCWPLDGGKFITAGLVLTKSPKTGARNLGIYRLQVLGRNEIALHWQIGKGGGFHYLEAEELNQPLEVAVIIGADPILWLAGILPLPEGVDEIAFAAFLRGKPVPMIACESINMEVPASAEIVLEGVVRPKRRALEGPFGDHFGHYSHASEFPVLEIQCVTRRADAVYHAAVVGKPPQEDRAMGEAVGKIFLPVIQMIKPEVADLWAYYEAGFHNLLALSVRQRYGKEAVKTALGILSEGQLSLSKCVFVVDAGVNARDFKAVLRAVRENFDPERDFLLLPNTAQDTLDFTGPKLNHGSKMILDATAKAKSKEDIPELPLSQIQTSRIKDLDRRILDFRLLEDALLAVKVKDGGKDVLRKLVQSPDLKGLKMAAVVSEDVPLDNDVLLLWGIFTRFDCQRDILFTESRLDGVTPVHKGILGIDATWKPAYPKPVEMSPEIVALVTNRWKEYGF